MTGPLLCNRPVRLPNGQLTICGGSLTSWWGTDGHSGRERFYTCEKCGATS